MADRAVRAAASAVLVAVSVAGCARPGAPGPTPAEAPGPSPAEAPVSPAYERPAVRFGSRAVRVEIADERAEQRTGLMHRTSLGRDEGMFFVFGRSVRTSFWMKNTLFPLSIAFMRSLGGGRFEVVSIQDMEPCREADPEDCPTYRPGRSYEAALEVNQGWFDAAGVREGAEAVYEPAD